MTTTKTTANDLVLLTAARGGWANAVRVAVGLDISADDVYAAADVAWDRGDVSASNALLRAAAWFALSPAEKRATRAFAAESVGTDPIGVPAGERPHFHAAARGHDRRPGAVCICSACLHTGTSVGRR